MLVIAGAAPAMAAPGDLAEAEGLFLAGSGGMVNLDSVAALAGPYNAFPPGDEESAAIDVGALGLVDLGLGVQLFGGNDVLALGATDQYARTDVTGAFASSGLIDGDGAIQAGTGAPGEDTTLNLTPALDDLDVADVVSAASLELSALAAEASATRGAAVTIDSDYQIAGGELVMDSPAIVALVADLDAQLTAASTAVNDLADDGGLIDTTVDDELGGIVDILDAALPGVLTLDDPTITSDVDLELSDALDTVAATPITEGGVTIDLAEGTITFDLDTLYPGLNGGLPANTVLFSEAGLDATIGAAIDTILTDDFATDLAAELDEVLNDTAVSIDVASGVSVAGVDAGDLALGIDTTLGAILGNPGAPVPTVSLEGTEIAGLLDPDVLVAPLTTFVSETLLPALGPVVDTALDPEGIETGVSAALDGAVADLDPLLAVVNEVVQITVNVQETPGTFRDPAGTDAGSFTQRAVQIQVAPDLAGSVVTLNLASATVRAVPLAAPSGLTIVPDRGPVTGGTPVVITGTGLTGVTSVTFGGTAGTDLVVNSDTSLSVVTPGHVEGVVTVAVTNPDGTDSSLTFEYYPVTVIDEIDPDSGTTEGGETVTLTGGCFTGATEVLFGGVAGTDLNVVSDSVLTVVTPPGTAGLVDVTVVNPTECGDATAEDGFTYVEPGAPTISDIDPPGGPETGGTTVEITGVGFDGTTSVTFGGIPAADFEVVSDTEIIAVTPPHVPEIVDVIVTNESGASAGFDFEFYDVTDIASVVPDAGPVAGGNTVMITGTCFTGATGVEFGGVAATSFTVDSATQITAVVPAGVGEGTVDVTVIGSVECGEATAEDAYEYFLPPVVTDLDPTEGPETGGTLVTITGTGFEGTTGVTFDGIPGTGLNVVSDTEIEVVTPAHLPGVVGVTVVHPGGDADAGDFEYLNVPGIASLAPDQGPEDGGTVVVVTGEGFLGADGVTFDGIPGTAFTVDSDTQITVTTPAHAPGLVDVIVLHENGDSAPFDFTYVEGTEVESVTPPGGPLDGGNTVIITGSCFTGATDVLFGGLSVASFTVDSDTQITAVVPAGTGIVDVTVVGADACGTDSLPDAYEYTDDPVIGTISPTSGPETGGTVVTITGVNFTGVTSVTFDGIAGTGLVVVSDAELRVTTPAGTPGAADVRVISPAGISDPGLFTYTPVTTVTGVTPGSGPTGGGTSVTITGSCFTGATAVLFGGVAATSFTVVSDTQIRATAPARSSAGTVTVSVVGAGTCGIGALQGGFTYFPGPAALAATGMELPLGLGAAALGLIVAGAGVWFLRRRTA